MDALDLELDLDTRVFVDLLDRLGVGITLARWEAPPDSGSFRFIWVNEAARELPGHGKDGHSYKEIVGSTLEQAFPELMDGPLPELYADAARTGSVRELGQLVLNAGDGAPASFHVRVEGFRSDLIAIVYTNNTEVVRLEKHRQKTLAALERSNEELDNFAYIASHDLKAPLRDVDNLSKWIAEDLGDDLPAEVQENLGLLRGRVQRMEALLEDLLEYSRAGRSWSRAQSFSLDSLFDDVFSLIQQDPGIEFKVTKQEGVQLETPKVPLEVILRNLLTNSMKHHDHATGCVTLSAQLLGEQVQFQVSDDGPGIPENLHEEAFRMFRTLQPRDRVEGTGMGLSLSKKLVEAHGGSISVESPGDERGTKVTFSWPRVFAPPRPTNSLRNEGVVS